MSAEGVPMTLGYWKIRGLAQSIRLLLKYTGADFKEVFYTVYCVKDEGPIMERFNIDGWLSDKFSLGLDYPNLPYLIDGDLKITQSNAILAHLGRKFNLYGTTENEKAYIDMLACVAMDFRNDFSKICYEPEMESKKSAYLSKARKKLEDFSKNLGDKPWFAGNEICYSDFPIYELFDQHKALSSELFNGLDNLKAYMDRFEALPAIKAYMSSPEFIRWPINNPIAGWGGEIVYKPE